VDTEPRLGVPPVTPPAVARKNWLLRHKILIGICAVLLLANFSSLANDGGTKSPTSSVVATESVPTSTTPDRAALDKAAAAQLGQTVRDGEFAFTVTAVTCGIAQVGTDVYLTQKAQGQYCRVSLNVENIGDQAQTMFARNQYLFDTKGRRFPADATANMYDDSTKLMFEGINPGNSIQGYFFFDVPRGTTVSKLELHDSMLSGGITVRL